MSSNHTTPPPVPGPFCAIVDPLLSLLALGELESVDAASANDHLAGCAWCQRRLREYETVHAALHRTYAPALPDLAPPSWSTIVALEAEREEDENAAEGTVQAPTLPRMHFAQAPHRRHIAAGAGALAAAILLIALLGSLLGWQHGFGGTPQPTPVPTLDSQTRTYVTMLHAYYQPVFVTLAQDKICEAAYMNAAASTKMNALLACRSTSQAVASAAQTLADQLQRAVPPARWQTAHHDLRTAVQATVNIYTARVEAIDAGSTSQFDALIPQTHAVLSQYCSPIELINAGLPASDGLNSPNLTTC